MPFLYRIYEAEGMALIDKADGTPLYNYPKGYVKFYIDREGVFYFYDATTGGTAFLTAAYYEIADAAGAPLGLTLPLTREALTTILGAQPYQIPAPAPEPVYYTYAVNVVGLNAAATPTDIFTVSGAAGKIVKIRKVCFSANKTGTTAPSDVLFLKRSTANTGGTFAPVVPTKYDSTNPNTAAISGNYTANPAALGTFEGVFCVYKYQFNTTGSTPQILEYHFETDEKQPAVLRGATEFFCINLNGAAITAESINITIQYTEETI